MKYEVSCGFCRHTQIYSPRGTKVPKKPHTNCKKCGKDFSIHIETSDPIPKVPEITKSALLKDKGQKSAVFDDSKFIDDPNELLMSDAIRELNKEHPDVRWATILVNILKETKQLEAVNKDREEVQSKLKQYSTEDLVKLRKRLTGNLQIDG